MKLVENFRPIKPIFVRHKKFGSNLKIGHFGPKMWLIGCGDERIIAGLGR